MSALPRGALVGDLYEVVRPIGKGGMATVYAARRRDDGAEVAVKVLALPEADRPGLEERFFRELLLLTRVRHPNVVAVHDFGICAAGCPFLVMDLLRGDTLHRALRRKGPLDEDRVARLFVDAVEALAEAHALGIVHQDLKPSNLFLREREDGGEDLVLLDFGIARRVRGGRATSEEWAATPRYAAPEYIRSREIRPCLDVYQLGLAMAEALCGRPVVESTDARECLEIHLEGRLALAPEVRESRLGPVIEQALRTDPDARWPDAAALLAALRDVIDLDDAPTSPSADALVRALAAPALADATQPSVPSEAPALVELTAPPALARPRRTAGLAVLLVIVVALLAVALAAWLAAG